MLSRLVVSLITLNICGVHLWLQCILLVYYCFYRNLLQLPYCIWLYVNLVLYIYCIYSIYAVFIAKIFMVVVATFIVAPLRKQNM